MKRKALVISSYPAPYRVAVFAAMSSKYDLDVFFYACKDENRNPEWFVKSDALKFQILNNRIAYKKYKSALRNIKHYDFVLAYDLVSLPTAKAIIRCQLLKIPYFINNDGAFIKKSFIKTVIKKFLFHGVSLCFASGKAAADYYKAYGVKQEQIRFHNFTSLTSDDILKEPLPIEVKMKLRDELNLDQKLTYIISVGQFIHRKGFDLLLEAWNMLGESVRDCKLLIIGGGNLAPQYYEYIKENELQNVEIFDFMSKEKLFKYFKACDIFCMPTREDIWGLVINEAMACGLPVVSSNMCIAASELVEENLNGYIYPVDNTEALNHYLKGLIINPEVRTKMCWNNIKKIQGNTMENIGKKHIHDIEEFFSAV